MSSFWYGYMFAVSNYFAFGFLFGIGYVIANLARYFSAGWRWGAMMGTVGMSSLVWPVVIIDLIEERLQSRRQRKLMEQDLQRRGQRVEPFEDPHWQEGEDLDLGDAIERESDPGRTRATVVESSGRKTDDG